MSRVRVQGDVGENQDSPVSLPDLTRLHNRNAFEASMARLDGLFAGKKRLVLDDTPIPSSGDLCR